MSTGYRLNVARFLLRRAARFAQVYGWQLSASLGGAPDDVAFELEDAAAKTLANPVRWLVNTELFVALTGRSVLKLRRRQRLDHRCSGEPYCPNCRHQACGFCPTCEPAAFGGGLFDDVL